MKPVIPTPPKEEVKAEEAFNPYLPPQVPTQPTPVV
jgi:hypothetical protein